MSERFSKLRKLMAKATPGHWSVDSERSEGTYGVGDDTHEGFDAFVVRADDIDHYGKPARICDAVNSDVGEVHEEFDEDGHSAWDEVGRRNMEFVAEAHNQLPEVLSALDAAEAEVARLREALEPFAAEAAFFRDHNEDNDEYVPRTRYKVTDPKLTFGHFRRARAALAPKEGFRGDAGEPHA